MNILELIECYCFISNHVLNVFLLYKPLAKMYLYDLSFNYNSNELMFRILRKVKNNKVENEWNVKLCSLGLSIDLLILGKEKPMFSKETC